MNRTHLGLIVAGVALACALAGAYAVAASQAALALGVMVCPPPR